MSEQSLGLIETLGLAAAVTAADAAVKSANVTLVGYEFAKGDGMTVVKLRGDVGAVKAAVAAAEMAAGRVGRVVATRVIARPVAGLTRLVESAETVGRGATDPVPVLPQAQTPPQEPLPEPVSSPPDASPSEVSGADPAAAVEPAPEPLAEAASEPPVAAAPEPERAPDPTPEPPPEPPPEPTPGPYRLTRPKGPKGR